MLSTLRSLLAGLGITRDIEYVDLGSYGARALIGEVRRTRLCLGGGRRALTVAHARTTRLEVTEGGHRTVLDVPASREPWPLLLASALVTLVARGGDER
ncbi:MAG: hypothetical protein EXR66_03695 [Dehalococcoidia bacterium]|nr:hypothetical protein [Dehalococcoidia bacterium]